MSLGCFRAKIKAGTVNPDAGQKLIDYIDAAEKKVREKTGDAVKAYKAAAEAADEASLAAADRAERARRQVITQAGIARRLKDYDDDLKALRAAGRMPLFLQEGRSPTYAAMTALLDHDPNEIAKGGNVYFLARQYRGEAHAHFADAIDLMRPKYAGLKNETALEIDVLDALYGDAKATPGARIVADAFTNTAEMQRTRYVAAGGSLPARKNWRIPNPKHDPAKIRTATLDEFKAFVRPLQDRNDMIDFTTGKPLDDARFEEILDDVYETLHAGGIEGPPSAAYVGRGALATRRDHHRVLVFKDAQSWLAYADRFGESASPYEAMTHHMDAMARETAMLDVLGPNPESTKRYVLSIFDREAGRLGVRAGEQTGKPLKRAVKKNRELIDDFTSDRARFENLWAEVTHENRVPISATFATRSADMRSVLVGGQMGSAIISSITDAPLALMTARFNGVPAWKVARRAIKMMATPGSEVYAARTGVVADTLMMSAGHIDKIMGETIRSGTAAKLGGAVIRASGLRRWTASWRNAVSLEFMGHVADHRALAFNKLPKRLREAFERYGLDAADWDLIRKAPLWEPQKKATFLRPMDVAAGGTAAHDAAAKKLARFINTETDYGVIEVGPRTRAFLLGSSKPGDAVGESRRAIAMYKSFPIRLLSLHFNRMVARGFDGRRLSHGALTFIFMVMLGAVAKQAKLIVPGGDPVSMDPTTEHGLKFWGGAVLQSGGLGIYGDLLFQDRTRYGNTWLSSLAGPQFAAIESIGGDFLIRNIQRWVKGEETHFAGDALYIGGRYLPGSNLWFARAAFQRAVLDQLALAIDERTPDRLRRLERNAEKHWGQESWWQRGRPLPNRAPDLSAIGH